MNCCTLTCEIPIDEKFWDERWKSNDTGWDIGFASPALIKFIDQIENKQASILIPGCGSGYEVDYLIEKGFENISVIEISETIAFQLKEKYKSYPQVSIIHGDFFELKGPYDYIFEQTFFCALAPYMRPKYVWKMHHLLSTNGKLEGLLFDKEFDQGPPFGGSKNEYIDLFSGAFEIKQMKISQDSIEPRKNTELAFSMKKNEKTIVNMYQFEGITCNGCRTDIMKKISEYHGVLNTQINSNFEEMLIVSYQELPIETIQELVSYEKHYFVKKIN